MTMNIASRLSRLEAAQRERGEMDGDPEIDAYVAQAFAAVEPELTRRLPTVEGYVRAALGDDGAQAWSAPVHRLAIEGRRAEHDILRTLNCRK
jgi:hypothetical protein